MKPDWKDAPDLASYLSQNPGGEWLWAMGGDGVPIPLTYGWKNPGGFWRYICDDQPNPNWRETLERRPEQSGHGTKQADLDAKSDAILRAIDSVAHLPHSLIKFDDEPDLIIPKDAATQIEAYSWVYDLARLGYRLEINSDGIRGWKE